jgi:prepilin-type N-terminal cleavage/methylation domain-containing protein
VLWIVSNSGSDNLKKGFVLIEVMFVLTIITIISSIGFMSFKSVKDYKSHVNAEYYSNVIVDFIDNSRQYCREKNCRGYILIDLKDDKLTFRADSRDVFVENFATSINLSSAKFGKSKTKIIFNNAGIVTNPGNIRFIDEKGEEHIITISVGTKYVRIKK